MEENKLKKEVIQPSFNFEPVENPVIKKLKELNIENTTPIEALNFLYEIKKNLK